MYNIEEKNRYATSLGDFSSGGELCVESATANEIHVVSTKVRASYFPSLLQCRIFLLYQRLISCDHISCFNHRKLQIDIPCLLVHLPLYWQDRVARVDGRFIHWVRAHGGGDRYSVIFYCTDKTRELPPVAAVDENFNPAQGE